MSTTDNQVEQFKEMVRKEWSDEGTVGAWRKWYPQMVVQWQAATNLLLEFAQPKPGMQVLEIAGGAGSMVESLAKAVGPNGHVTETDLSAGMLATSKKNAQQAGLTNVSFEQADAHALQFPDQQFDLVTSRFGVMFFADGVRALKEIYRVLKPGGCAAFIVWGAMERNPFPLTAMGPFAKRVALPPPPPGAPQPMKYAQEGTLSEDLRQAGLKQVREEGRKIDFPWPGTPEELWQNFYDMSGMFHPVMESLPANDREQAISEVITGFRQFFDGKQVNPTAYIIVASGTR